MENQNPKNDKPLVIAIGASAGGLESLTEFFDDIPEQSPYCFVIIQHLSPDYKSYTDEFLTKKTNIPILEAEDGATLKKSHIYLVPSSKNLTIEKGVIRLKDKPKGKVLNLPVDLFFESIAVSYKERVIGIIMSGTGSDGCKGIKYIKTHGGLVIAQQPDQAKFPGMPERAILTNLVDFVLPVQEMYREIQNFFKTPDLIEVSKEFANIDEKSLRRILDLIEESTDLDFNQYKKPTLMRRMSRRMKILQLDSIKEYHHYLEDNEEEIETLYRDFLIGVTKFFRDKGAWDVIRKHVVPEIVKYKNSGEEIKIWDVGCNTGEETYSLAILFFEECKKVQKKIKLKIFASDISQYSLDIASKGIYELNSVVELGSHNISAYFTKQEDGSYKISDQIRRSIVFTNHNILKDPPFKNTEMVLCRNLLIYLQNPVQQRVLKVIHYSLKLDGFLMLGHSESLGSEQDYYEDVSRKWKIYKNIKTSHRNRNGFLNSGKAFSFSSSDKAQRKEASIEHSDSMKRRRRAEESLSAAILEQFNATTIHIDDSCEIIEARGYLGRYATFPKDGFSNNLLKILPEKFELPIKTAINKARKSQSRIIHEKIYVEDHEGLENGILVDIMVLPLTDSEMGKEANYLVTIIERGAEEINETIIQTASISSTASTRIKDLEEELEQTKAELTQAIEETETSNEELQASNEELLASNEELQSTNEELQSVNEELHIVNGKHIDKMDELASLNADMDNLLESTDIGVLYLDSDLRVRKFTPSVQEHFSFIKQDVGRHIDNFTLSFSGTEDVDLVQNAKKVMQTEKAMDKRVVSKSGRHFLKRITPFMGVNHKVSGVIIAFIDIEEIHDSQERHKFNEKKFKDFYDSDPVMHASVNTNTGVLVECNKKYFKLLGYPNKRAVIGKPILDFYSDSCKLKATKALDTLRQGREVRNVELILISKSGAEIPVMLNSNVKRTEDGTLLTRSTLLDISKIKEIENELRYEKKNLEQANRELEQFVSICSHDLQEPLSTIRFGSDLLLKDYSDQLSDKGQEYASYIHEASGRLSDQIKALLEHSKLGQNVQKTDVDMAELVEVVKYDLSKRIAESKSTITATKLPTITGFETELRLLFQNLISNAIKYSRAGVPPNIRISAFDDNEFYVFSIVDNGLGIAEEDLVNIFTIFNRGNSRHKEAGTGVGLAHCEKIVKLHDGKIWVSSQLGVGSTFHFKLRK